MAVRPVSKGSFHSSPSHQYSQPLTPKSPSYRRCASALLPDLSAHFHRAVSQGRKSPAYHFSTRSSMPAPPQRDLIQKKGEAIRQCIEKASNSSLPEQQQLMLGGIVKNFKDILDLPSFEKGFTQADVQYLLNKTEWKEDFEARGVFGDRTLFSPQVWTDQHWEKAIRILLFRLGKQKAPWASQEAKDHFLKKLTAQKILYPKAPLKIYPSQIYEIPGSAARSLIPSLKEEAQKNPGLSLILIQEGVWSGRVLVDFYQQVSQEVGIPVKIVGSDFNPASLGMFLVHAEHIAGIPRKDILAFKNDLNFPLTPAFLEQQGLRPKESLVCYLYFPVFYNVEGNEGIETILKKLSSMMKKGDKIQIYEPEDSDPKERQVLRDKKATISAKCLL